MSGRQWKPGSFAVIGWKMTSGQERAIWTGQHWFTESGIAVYPGDVTDAHPLAALDPEDYDAVTDLMRRFWREADDNHGAREMQAALCSLAEPEPEVYEHFVQSGGAVKRSLCGKVFWEPDERSVSMGKCPECAALVEAGWIK